MTSDRLDRIELLLHRCKTESQSFHLLAEAVDLLADEVRYLRRRPLTEQAFDSGQELLKEQN